jgi:death-on-curing protein
MSEPIWVRREAAESLHALSLKSALARPRNLHLYEGTSDLARLAACYAVGLAKNHAFIDGNKRVAFIAAGAFLRLNGLRLVAKQAEATLVMLSVASSAMTEEELAIWISRNTQPL